MVCVSFYVICIVERLVSSVICRFQGLSYSHVPECIEFSFILFIHHNIHFYFELCHRDCCHYIGHSYIGLHYLLRLLQICTRPSPTTKLTWIWLWWCHRYVTAIKQRMFERGRQRLQSSNHISFLKIYCPTETEWYGVQKVQGIKHINKFSHKI